MATGTDAPTPLPTTRPAGPQVLTSSTPRPVGVEDPAPVQSPRVWAFGEDTYTQRELSIEGEALLVGLATRILEALATEAAATGGTIPLGELVQDDGSVNVALAAKLVTTISAQIPEIAGQALAILFGNYPTDLDDQPNEEFPRIARRLARQVPSTQVVAIIQEFVRQNDYQRLAGPFGEVAARFGIETPWAQPGAASEASPDSPPQDTATPARSSGGSRSGRRSGT